MARPVIDWAKIEADRERGFTHRQLAALHGVSAAAVGQHFAPGHNTSVYLGVTVAERMAVVKQYTRLTSAQLLEVAVNRVLAELQLSWEWPPGKPCYHEFRWPNGRCKACWNPAPGTAEFVADFDARQEQEARLNDVI